MPLKREPTNPADKCAVSIRKAGETVGHVPFTIAPTVLAFLKRACNKGLVEVMGNRINRGAGYSLEIPCKYHFNGSTLHIERLKTIVCKIRSDGLV